MLECYIYPFTFSIRGGIISIIEAFAIILHKLLIGSHIEQYITDSLLYMVQLCFHFKYR